MRRSASALDLASLRGQRGRREGGCKVAIVKLYLRTVCCRLTIGKELVMWTKRGVKVGLGRSVEPLPGHALPWPDPKVRRDE